MTTRKSSSYLTTLDTKSVADMQTLAQLRKMVTMTNRDMPLDMRKRICIRGRKPFVKMKDAGGHFYRASKGLVSYDRGGNIVGGIANASMFDVYLYTRR